MVFVQGGSTIYMLCLTHTVEGLIGGWIGEEGRRADDDDDGVVFGRNFFDRQSFLFLADLSDILLPAFIESEWTGCVWVPLFNAHISNWTVLPLGLVFFFLASAQ